MRAPQRRRAITAATAVAESLGLPVAEAVVLNASNKLTLLLSPGEVVARVAPASHGIAAFELDLAASLTEAGCPVVAPDPRTEPRVHSRDGFDISLWTYHEPVTTRPLSPDEYAGALVRLHAGMREVAVPTPHFTDRIDEARQLLADPPRTPELAEADRRLLADALRTTVTGRGPEQLLHGEPHPGNLLATAAGPLFIDFETCCRGPVEFDLAHAPDAVADHYPGADPELLRDCRIVMLAMVTTWRWDREDRLPNGRRLAAEWLARIRVELGR